jgi:hypothetical protein
MLTYSISLTPIHAESMSKRWIGSLMISSISLIHFVFVDFSSGTIQLGAAGTNVSLQR